MIHEEDVAFYNENGYLLVRGVFSMDEVEVMRQAVDGIIERAARTQFDHNAAWPSTGIRPIRRPRTFMSIGAKG